MRILVRSLFASRAFAVTAIGTIALATSLAATVFAVVDGVLFKPLPYPRAAELFEVRGSSREPRGSASLAIADVEYLRSADPLVAVAAYASVSALREADRPDVVLSALPVDPYLFDVLGQYPLVGGFSREHFVTSAEATQLQPAIVSYGFWRDRLGADASSIGRTLDLVEGRLLVVGVLPHDFLFPVTLGTRPDMVVPFVSTQAMRSNRFMRRLTGIARIRSGIAREAAQAKLDAALAAHVGEYPQGRLIPGPYDAVTLRPLDQLLGRNERPMFAAGARRRSRTRCGAWLFECRWTP